MGGYHSINHINLSVPSEEWALRAAMSNTHVATEHLKCGWSEVINTTELQT